MVEAQVSFSSIPTQDNDNIVPTDIIQKVDARGFEKTESFF